MLQQISSYIKSLDYFGHKIELVFNSQGSQHNTLIGGSVSIFVKVLYYSYFLLLLRKFVYATDDSVDATFEKQNLNELGEIKWTDMNIHWFFNLAGAYADQ